MLTMEPSALHVDQDISAVQGGAAYFMDIECRLAPYFERAEPRWRAMASLRGLLSPAERKHSWQLAEVSGDTTPYSFQHLLRRALWNQPQALLCTELTAEPVHILKWFVLRWRLEVTWQEARAHLGLEAQRQWNALAIARTTPALLGLFSIITLLAGHMAQEHALPVRTAVGDRKIQPTFTDATAVVRQHMWTSTHFYMSPAKADMVEIPGALLNRLTDTLGYTA